MTLDLMSAQIGGKRKGKGKGKGSRRRSSRKGGSMIADASVPAGLFLLHRYLKNRKSRKVGKPSRKRRRTFRRRR
tara:strand:- start:26 stop:250 length:225 start_codon:yes stop_codon:yes gene_type:complete